MGILSATHFWKSVGIIMQVQCLQCGGSREEHCAHVWDVLAWKGKEIEIKLCTVDYSWLA